MKTRKICMIGDFAVGKTSLVSRFVHQCFGEKYMSTVGVKIDARNVTLPSGDQLKLVLWDIAGKSAFARIDESYLRNAAGYLLVVDGTRAETLDSAIKLQRAIQRQLGDVPFCMLINKSDLKAQWHIDQDRLAALDGRGWPSSKTSALDGSGVEQAFHQLGARMVHEL